MAWAAGPNKALIPANTADLSASCKCILFVFDPKLYSLAHNHAQKIDDDLGDILNKSVYENHELGSSTILTI